MNLSILPTDFIKLNKNVINLDLFIKSLENIPTSIRLNPYKLKKEELQISYKTIPWNSDGILLEKRPEFVIDPLWHSGHYYVQEASSMFVREAIKQTINLNQPLKVLDIAASPGGKTTDIISILNDESLMIANEISFKRATILKENLIKWGHDNIIVTNNSPVDFKYSGLKFDIIIADMPCSGEGMFRKDKNSLKDWSTKKVKSLHKRQKEILKNIWPILKENGILIYSTCTYNTLENEESIKYLIDNFNAQSVKLDISNYYDYISESKDQNIFVYRFLPYKTIGEGFTISVIKKTFKDKKDFPGKQNNFYNFTECFPEDKLLNLLTKPESFSFFKSKDNSLRAINKSLSNFLLTIPTQLKILHTGIILLKDNNYNISLFYSKHFNKKNDLANYINFDNPKEAIIFFGNNNNFDAIPVKNGINIIMYKEKIIDVLIKNSNTIENLFPTQWRIKNQKIDLTQSFSII